MKKEEVLVASAGGLFSFDENNLRYSVQSWVTG